MKKTKVLFISSLVLLAIAFAYRGNVGVSTMNAHNNVQQTKYGSFLAAQHAIYINDFDSAAKYTSLLDDEDGSVVKNTKVLATFLSGKLPENVADLSEESGTPARLIYDAYLVGQGDWNKLYTRHKNDTSALAAPLRIWASVAINHRTEAIKFIDSLQTNTSWKSFVHGQIYAESGNVEKAAAEFANVRPDFMNINDYLYIMSFYRHNGLTDKADTLRKDFTSRPGGMFMLDYDVVPDWSHFSGIKNALAFSLIQNVSHTQVMMYSDLSILLLRFAKIISDENSNNDAINYYIGQYFFNNDGDYEAYFSKIGHDSPFYLFAILRECESGGNMAKLRRVVNEHSLFVPAINKLVAYYTANGDKRAALRILKRAMNNENISDTAHAFFLKNRALVYYTFGDLSKAQSDIRAASDVLAVDTEILVVQAKIWAEQNRELYTAYDYAISLVQRNPSDVLAWDTLGRVVAAREGPDAALELIERVGEVAKDCSSLFENLGDLYVKTGKYKLARDAYTQAIELSGDGMVVVPKIQKKIRKLK